MEQLEFELEEVSRKTEEVIYKVKRKGLIVGMIGLNNPYNKDKKRTEMIIR